MCLSKPKRQIIVDDFADEHHIVCDELLSRTAVPENLTKSIISEMWVDAVSPGWVWMLCVWACVCGMCRRWDLTWVSVDAVLLGALHQHLGLLPHVCVCVCVWGGGGLTWVCVDAVLLRALHQHLGLLPHVRILFFLLLLGAADDVNVAVDVHAQAELVRGAWLVGRARDADDGLLGLLDHHHALVVAYWDRLTLTPDKENER